MRNRRQRIWLLFLFLVIAFAVWALPYAGRVYFKALQNPSPSVSVVLPGVVPVLEKAGEFDLLRRFDFQTTDSLKVWEEKIFKGKTEYTVVREGETGFLLAASKASSSGLYKKVKVFITPEIVLSWDWKASEFPKKPDPNKLASRAQDDFAARIYLVFPGSTFFGSNVIEYIWDENLPAGTVAPSPFSDRVKLFVIRSGKPGNENGGWTHEERNIYQDYTALFETKPDRELEALALMSDSDNTRSSSQASFKTFELKSRKTEST